MKKEEALQKWRSSKLRGLLYRGSFEIYPEFEDIDCPTELAQLLRDNTWKKQITSITMPPMQHQITLSSPLYSRTSLWDQNNHFTYKIHPVTKTYSEYNPRPFGTSGLKPFIGHVTKAGAVSPTIQFVEKDVVLSKVKNMVSLISWTNKSKHLQDGSILESNVSVLIEYILKFYTDTPLSDLYPFIPQRKSGTIQHHLRSASFRESIVPNTLSNYYQQVIGESNSHITYASSTAHYTVNFLHI